MAISEAAFARRKAGADAPREAIERNLSDQVAAVLGREIVRGLYPPGAQLPNAEEMCARFQVSRTALREAYSLLSAKALIVARPKTGTRVRPRQEWNLFDPDVLAWHMQSEPTGAFINDLFVLRQMVEPAAAALAAQTQTPSTLERIAAAYAIMERSADGSGGLIEADLDFHMSILGATDNPFLTALGGLIHASLQCAFRYSWEGAARIHDSRLSQHRLILDAIRSGEPNEARERMRELLSDSLEDVRVFLARKQAPAPS